MPVFRTTTLNSASNGAASAWYTQKDVTTSFEITQFDINGVDASPPRPIFKTALNIHGYTWEFRLHRHQPPVLTRQTRVESGARFEGRATLKFPGWSEQNVIKFSIGAQGFVFSVPIIFPAVGNMIEVTITGTVFKEWYPQRVQPHPTLISLFNNSAASDALFIVEKAGFRSEFPVHKCILETQCTYLFDLIIQQEACDESKDGKTTVEVTDTAPDVFRSVIEYIYSVKAPAFFSESGTILILKAADKYGLSSLKLFAESILTYKYLSLTNAPDLLLFADSNSCALLKEAALKLAVAQPGVFFEASGYSKVKESADLMADLFEMRVPPDTMKRNKGFKSDVLTLRQRAEQNGLALDGTREMLVARLKDHYKSKKNNPFTNKALQQT